jgi:hypothetical protein
LWRDGNNWLEVKTLGILTVFPLILIKNLALQSIL